MNVIGIDVSNKTLDCCLLIHNEPYYHNFENNEDGFFKILALYHDFKCVVIGFESTGNYHKKLEKYLYGNGCSPYIIKPVHIANFKKLLPVHGKTDKIDSYSIALYLLQADLKEYLSYPIRQKFNPIITSIILLEKQIRQTKNVIHSFDLLPETVDILDGFKNTVITLDKTKKDLESKAIKLLYIECPEAIKIKEDIDGVGDKLLLYLIPHLYDHFDKYSLKQINAFFGLNPVSFESGTSVKKRDHMSRRGDKKIMKMLYMSSVSAVRNNEILKAKYDRLKENGKPSKVALVSVMSHLLRAIVIKLSHYTNRPYKK
jgi:transposase